MCGICGVISADEKARPVVEKMLPLLVHRGPDHQGVYHYVQAHGSVALGNRRLAIMDIDKGNQPFTNETGEIIVVFNGEIYNYRELRARLIDKGHTLKTQCDTEILPHLYEDEGDQMVHSLVGQFAFAVYDHRDKSLLLARDRFGIKPLWYVHRKNSFIFSSEPQVFWKCGLIAKELDLVALDRFLAHRTVPPPRHLFKGIRALNPGSVLHYRKNFLKIRRYWSYPTPVRSSLAQETLIQQAEELIQQAVKSRLLSDVPVGLMLSGGVDSAYILALMRESQSAQLHTWSAGFAEQPQVVDELPYAREMAGLFNTEHHEIIINGQMVNEHFDRIIRHQPNPCGDGIQKYFLNALIVETGKVALTGSGGDELFGGYEWFQQVASDAFLDRFTTLLPQVAGWWARQWLQKRNFPAFIKKLLHSAAFPGLLGRFQWYKLLFKNYERRKLYADPALSKAPGADHFDRRWQRLIDSLTHCSEFDTIIQLQIRGDLTDLILPVEDAMSMAHSVEARVPYLDHRFAEYIATLPFSLRYRRGRDKYLLRHLAAQKLPARTAYRKKQGFIMPIRSWLNGPLKERVNDVLTQSQVNRRGLFNWKEVAFIKNEYELGRQGPYKLWNLFMLECWLQRHLDDR